MIYHILEGMLLGFSLIIAIGAQNAFVLRMSLLQSHVLYVFLFCALSDIILIFAGIFGAYYIEQLSRDIILGLTLGGGCYILYMAFSMAKHAFSNETLEALDVNKSTLYNTLRALILVTWLNPHVYLDTFGIFGATSLTISDIYAKLAYAIGGSISSILWFSALCLLGYKMSHILRNKKVWRALHLVFATIMFYVAIRLLQTSLTLI